MDVASSHRKEKRLGSVNSPRLQMHGTIIVFRLVKKKETRRTSQKGESKAVCGLHQLNVTLSHSADVILLTH